MQTFHTPTPPELEIRVPVGKIDVETIDGEESTVTVEGSDKLVDQTAIELVGNRLSVKFRKKLFWGSDFGRTHLDVRVRVPHSTAVLISTASVARWWPPAHQVRIPSATSSSSSSRRTRSQASISRYRSVSGAMQFQR